MHPSLAEFIAEIEKHRDKNRATKVTFNLGQILELLNYLYEQEKKMSIVADAINGLEAQLATAQAAVPNPALVLQQDAAAAIVKWAAAQTPPVTVDPAIVALAATATPAPANPPAA